MAHPHSAQEAAHILAFAASSSTESLTGHAGGQGAQSTLKQRPIARRWRTTRYRDLPRLRIESLPWARRMGLEIERGMTDYPSSLRSSRPLAANLAMPPRRDSALPNSMCAFARPRKPSLSVTVPKTARRRTPRFSYCWPHWAVTTSSPAHSVSFAYASMRRSWSASSPVRIRRPSLGVDPGVEQWKQSQNGTRTPVRGAVSERCTRTI